jgi:hypothetical protein
MPALLEHPTVDGLTPLLLTAKHMQLGPMSALICARADVQAVHPSTKRNAGAYTCVCMHVRADMCVRVCASPGSVCVCVCVCVGGGVGGLGVGGLTAAICFVFEPPSPFSAIVWTGRVHHVLQHFRLTLALPQSTWPSNTWQAKSAARWSLGLVCRPLCLP